MIPRLTILWTALSEKDTGPIKAAIRDRGADLISVERSTIWRYMASALAQGPVVAIVADDGEASSALSMGVDEVVRVGEVTYSSLDRAIRAAEVRAGARFAQRDEALLAQHAECAVFDLLAGAASHELSTRLMTASIDCEMLSASVTELHSANQARMIRASSLEDEMGAVNEFGRPIRVVGDALRDIRSSLAEASAAVRSLNELTRVHGVADAGVLVRDIANLLRKHLSPWADLSAESFVAAGVALNRGVFVCLAAALISNAIDGIRLSGRRGKISLRLSTEDGAAVFEIEDDGVPIADRRYEPTFEPLFRAAHGRGAKAALLAIRERVRRLGGELLIDSEGTVSRVQVFLPSTMTDIGFEDVDVANRSTPLDRFC